MRLDPVTLNYPLIDEQSVQNSGPRRVAAALVGALYLSFASTAGAQAAPPAEPAPRNAEAPEGAAPAPGAEPPVEPAPQAPAGTAPPAAAEPPAAPPPEASAPPASPAASDAEAAPVEPPAAEPAPEDEKGANLEAVTVFAQKRSQSVQSVPSSVTAISGSDVQLKLDNDPGSLSRVVPSLYSSQTGNRGSRPNYFLRGVGANTGITSPVAVYYDEVVLNILDFQSFPLFDLDRIEALRGPQGTLWGKNTTGGALHFVTKKPTFEPDGYVKGTLGNFGRRELQGGFSSSVIKDKVAVRASFFHDERGGWADNLATGATNVGAYNDNAFRGQVLWLINDNWDALANVHFRSYNGQPVPTYHLAVNANGLDNYGYTSGYTKANGLRPSYGDPISQNADGSEQQTSVGTSLKLRGNIGRYELTSISAFERLNYGGGTDRDASPNEVISTHSIRSTKQVTEEIRLASPKEDRLSWIAGAYFFREDYRANATSATLPSDPQVTGTFFQNTLAKQVTTSYALFGNLALEITKRFKVNGGVRWTNEKVAIDQAGGSAGARGSTVFATVNQWWLASSVYNFQQAYQQDESKTWNSLTWEVTPQFEITPDALSYFRYARGFRSGGYNVGVTDASQLGSFNPETLDAFELGLKTRTLRGRLIANLAAYYYLWNDLQLNIQGVSPEGLNASTIRNAAQGRAKGLDLEVTALPINNLTLSGSLGLLDGKYEDFVGHTTMGDIDYSGLKFARAPSVTANVGAEYRIPFDFGSFGLGTDWSYSSRVYFSSVDQTDPEQQQAPYVIGNARVSFRTVNNKLELTAFSNNVGNQNYRTMGFLPSNGYQRITLGFPRTYGAALVLRY